MQHTRQNIQVGAQESEENLNTNTDGNKSEWNGVGAVWSPTEGDIIHSSF